MAEMINRSDVMKAAWRRYRLTNRGRPFDRSIFAFSLGNAWDAAKWALKSDPEREIASIKAEIDALVYKPAHVNIVARENALRAKLATLAA